MTKQNEIKDDQLQEVTTGAGSRPEEGQDVLVVHESSVKDYLWSIDTQLSKIITLLKEQAPPTISINTQARDTAILREREARRGNHLKS